MKRPSYQESVLSFACEGESLLGIVSTPTKEEANGIGVIIVVGGPQYRIGSHRLFVRLARSLADKGFTVLRFDYRGMGDSSGTLRDFQAVNLDIKAAIDALLKTKPSLLQIVLWGLCDGASASLLYCDNTQDSRVHGLVVLNPWARSAASLARTQVKHYYLQRLRQLDFWKKLSSGKVAITALRDLAKSIQKSLKSSDQQNATQISFQDRMARAWTHSDRKILLLLSEQDYTAKEFLEVRQSSQSWSKAIQSKNTQQIELKGADHTLSNCESAHQAFTAIEDWLNKLKDHNHAEI
jgi:exosortase A-associated hydrolase 1